MSIPDVSAIPYSGARRAEWQVLGALSLPMLLASLGASISNVALPTLMADFEVPFGHVQWVAIAYLLASTATVVGVGRLGDMFGHRKLLLAGLAAYGAGSAIGSIAPSLWLLVAARALQGTGAAAMIGLSMALVGDAVPKARTGSAMGLLATMSAIGTALGPSLGGFLIAAFGWWSIFSIGVPLTAVAVGLVLRALPADRIRAEAGGPAGFDHAGAVLLALSLAFYSMAATVGGSIGISAIFLLAAAVSAIGLVAIGRRAKLPLVDPTTLRAPGMAAGLAANALVAAVMMATLVVGPFHLAGAFGLDPARIGLVMSIGPAISIACGIPAGKLVDRVGTHAVAILGLTGISGGSFLLALFPAEFGVAGYIAGIAVLTPAYQLFQAANNTATLKGIAPAQRGAISGVLALSRNLGLVTGASLMGAIYIFAGTHVPVAEASIAGMRATFVVAGLFGGLAAVLVALFRRPPRAEE